MTEKILIVDDDPDILATFKRNLGDELDIDTALEGKKGLESVSRNGPYAVIVSDMRMPGMDGVQFLSKVREIAPESVRIMLTGNADQETAKEAVNEGRIFRFLTKPCPSETFTKTLAEGIREYQLITAERELMEKTLSRSVKVLIDILSMVNPLAFSRSLRMRRYVKHMAKRLKLHNAWQYELAALLSQIGSVTLPAEIFQKQLSGEALTSEEQEMFNTHPTVGRDLLITIPRMESVAQMIGIQQKPYSAYDCPVNTGIRDPVILGAQILKVAIAYEEKIATGMTANQAVDELLVKSGDCDPALSRTLRNIEIGKSKYMVKNVDVSELNTEMIIDESINTKSGLLVVHKGQEITYPMLKRLKNYKLNKLIGKKIRVLVTNHGRADSNEKKS